jgi:prophage antirepressor-like protein
MTEMKITPFLFEGEAMVRVVDRDSAPWFVVADVCRVLEIKNPTQAAEALDDDERAMFNIGRQGEANCVSEGGLYTLVLRSRDATKPGTVAHRFRKWVTGEVLPAIRQTGGYEAPAPDEDMEPQTPDGLKLRKVNTAIRAFGERAGAQLWAKLGLDWVPAMAHALRQTDILDSPTPPGMGSVTITVSPAMQNGQGTH